MNSISDTHKVLKFSLEPRLKWLRHLDATNYLPVIFSEVISVVAGGNASVHHCNAIADAKAMKLSGNIAERASIMNISREGFMKNWYPTFPCHSQSNLDQWI